MYSSIAVTNPERSIVLWSAYINKKKKTTEKKEREW